MGIYSKTTGSLQNGSSALAQQASFERRIFSAPDILRSHKINYLTRLIKRGETFEQQNTQITHDAFGFPLTIAPGVYAAHPDTSHSSGIVIDNLPGRLDGKTFLDVGCGSGVIALTAAHRGASKILAVDYNYDAVKLTQQNILQNNLCSHPDIQVMQSDVVELVSLTQPDHRFDVVAANLWFPVYEPYLDRNDPRPQLETYRSLFNQFRKVVSPDGIVMLTSADFATVADIREMMFAHGIDPHLSVSDKKHFGGTTPMQWHLYTFGADGQPVDPREWAACQKLPEPVPLLT